MERIEKIISDDAFKAIRDRLEGLAWNESEHCCFVLGFGGKLPRDYQLLSGQGLEVLWHGFDGPWYCWPISIIGAAEFGVVRARTTETLVRAFEQLSEQSACAALMLAASQAEPLSAHFRQHGLKDFSERKAALMGGRCVLDLYTDTDLDEGVFLRCEYLNSPDCFGPRLLSGLVI